MNKLKYFIYGVVIFLASYRVDAVEPPPFIRIWEGTKPADVSDEAFYAFLSQVLIPTTVSANPDSLHAYLPIVLDPGQPLPPEAFLKALPFHEAALVVHQNEQAYNEARQKNPWYGPAHFLKGGGFDDKLSFSAGPKPFAGALEIATPTSKFGFDLRGTANTWVADWQKGFVVASVILRKKNVPDADYLPLAAQYATAVQKDLAPVLDGQFIRVGPGHILEFLRFRGQAEYEKFRPVLDQISAQFNSGLIFDYYRKLVEATPHGVAQAGPGKAFSIQFERPFRGCAGTLVAVAK